MSEIDDRMDITNGKSDLKFGLCFVCIIIFTSCEATKLPEPGILPQIVAGVSCTTSTQYDCITGVATSPASTSTGTPSTSATTPSYKVKITASGMTGSIILYLNSSELLTISSAGSYVFTTSVLSGNTYSVSITTKPDSHSCSLSSSSGTMSSGDVTIALICRPFKFIFVTSGPFTGALSGINGADSICNSNGNRPDTNSTYKALIGSTNGMQRYGCTTAGAQCSNGIDDSVNWVLYPLTTYKRASDSLVIGTTTTDRVFNIPLTNPLGSSGLYWSGFENTVSYHGYTIGGTAECAGWNDGSGASWGNRGDLAVTSVNASNTTNLNCNNTYPILCAEQ